MADKQTNCCKQTSIGGQALIEGIMMRGPVKTAMAVRNPAGEIVIEKWDTQGKKKLKITQLPFIRGMFNFIGSMKVGYKALMRSAEIAMPEENENATEDEKKKESRIMAIAAGIGGVLGVILCIGLFLYLPSFLYSLIAEAAPSIDSRIVRSIFEGVLRMALFIGYIGLMCLVKDVRRTFEYHGAEHKTIFCYEAGLPLTVENVRMQKRFHPRCGTSFMILMLIVGIVVGMFIPTEINGFVINNILRTVIKLALLPLTVGIGYELIKLCGRHNNILTRIIAAPGIWLQRLTVHEPDDRMIECAIAAMNEVIPENGEDDSF